RDAAPVIVVATVGAFPTMGFSLVERPPVNSNSELTGATSLCVRLVLDEALEKNTGEKAGRLGSAGGIRMKKTKKLVAWRALLPSLALAET
ncbi:MAG: hypothetical protein ACRD19_08835, partial [Terriglobia bacterium]